jgi:RHS repeat-associated protein
MNLTDKADYQYNGQNRMSSSATRNVVVYNYGYRDYQPQVARFTTIDPIRDGSNWFAYVNNDPVNYFDPNGLQSVWELITVWHYEDRDAQNTITETVDTIKNKDNPNNKWRQEDRDIFHQDGDEYHDNKYTHPDGREVVIDGKTGEIVTASATRGTYNYVYPGVTPDIWYDIGGWIEYGTRAVGHFFADVLPYFILGNDRPNNTNGGCAD